MTTRRDRGREPLPAKAFYSVPELARAAGIHRDRMARHLKSLGVSFGRTGSDRVVYLSELERLAPALVTSLIRLEEIQRVA